MRRILIFLLAFALSFSLGCASAKGGNYAPGYEQITGAEITDEGLNDLRDVVGGGWGYALVARDCIFNEFGYYKFSDVLEHNLKQMGVALGEEWERELFYARGEACVYGVYRTNSGKSCSYYAFSGDYETAEVNLKWLGNYPAEEAFIGYEGTDGCRLMLIGKALIAYDFISMCVLDEESIPFEFEYPNEDFSYYQKGNAAAFFNTQSNATLVYTYEISVGLSCVAVLADKCYDDSYPMVISNYYLFNEDVAVCLTGDYVEADAEKAKNSYISYYLASLEETVTDGTYIATIEDGNAVIDKLGFDIITLSVQQIVNGCFEVKSAVEKRGTLPQITAVKLVNGEIFIILEKTPNLLEGIRDVNDGIPQMVVRYDYSSGKMRFCGMVDFTVYSVYRIVKL